MNQELECGEVLMSAMNFLTAMMISTSNSKATAFNTIMTLNWKIHEKRKYYGSSAGNYLVHQAVQQSRAEHRHYIEGIQTDFLTLEESDCNSPYPTPTSSEEIDTTTQQIPSIQENDKETTASTCDNERTVSTEIHLEHIEEEVTDNELSISLHSKLATAIAQALGPSNQLQELDKIG